MTYTPVYTTVDALEKRLKGWAEVYGSASAFGASQVNGGLLLQVAEQNEAKVNRILGKRYQLPLVVTHPELASVVEKLTVCELIGQFYAGQEPSEKGGYGALMCSQGKAELKALEILILPDETPLGDRLSAATTRAFSGVRTLPNQVVDW